MFTVEDQVLFEANRERLEPIIDALMLRLLRSLRDGEDVEKLYGEVVQNG